MFTKLCFAFLLFSFFLSFVSGEMRPFQMSEKKRATNLDELRELQNNPLLTKLISKKKEKEVVPAFDPSLPLFHDPELERKRDLSSQEKRDSEILSMADDEVARRVFSAKRALKKRDSRLKNAMSRF